MRPAAMASHMLRTSKSGAMGLARRLERYWHERGTGHAVWAEPIAERFAKVGTYEIYRVN
jgi:hypothetical protein